jgi:hypothetical protein
MDVFPHADKPAAQSYNAISRLVLFGGLGLYGYKRDPTILGATALLMLYLWSQQNKYTETYYMSKLDRQIEDMVAPKRDQNKEAKTQEVATAARRMVDNPRDIGPRPAIVPTTDDKIYPLVRCHPKVIGQTADSHQPTWTAKSVYINRSSVRLINNRLSESS